MKIVNKPKPSSFDTIFREEGQCQLHLLEMSGENCAIPGCSISRKDKGISIFKVPLANNKFSPHHRSLRFDSNSEAISAYYHKSNALSHVKLKVVS